MTATFIASDDEQRAVETIRNGLPKGLTMQKQDEQMYWTLDDRVHKAWSKLLATNNLYNRNAVIHAMRLAIHHIESVNKRET